MGVPQEVLDKARAGDTVRYQLRGPASDEELKEVEKDLEAYYPGVNFELSADGEVSSAEIVEG